MFLKLLNFKVETIYYKIHSEVVKKIERFPKQFLEKNETREFNLQTQFFCEIKKKKDS